MPSSYCAAARSTGVVASSWLTHPPPTTSRRPSRTSRRHIADHVGGHAVFSAFAERTPSRRQAASRVDPSRSGGGFGSYAHVGGTCVSPVSSSHRARNETSANANRLRWSAASARTTEGWILEANARWYPSNVSRHPGSRCVCGTKCTHGASGEHGASKEAPWTPRSRKSSSSALSFGCPPPNEAERSSADDGHTRTRNTPRVKRTSAVFTRARISFVRRRAAAPPSSGVRREGSEGERTPRETVARTTRKSCCFSFSYGTYRTSPTPISPAPRHSSSPSRSSSATSTLRTNRNVRNSSPRPPPRHPFPA